jgi:hypothetical protein
VASVATKTVAASDRSTLRRVRLFFTLRIIARVGAFRQCHERLAAMRHAHTVAA